MLDGQRWIVAVIVGVIAVSAAVIGSLRLRDIPDRAIGHSPPPHAVADPRERLIEYLLDGDPGRHALVSYLTPEGHVVDADVVLPWRTQAPISTLTAAVGLAAQTNGSRLRCEIAVDGQSRILREATADAAVVNCSVPAA